MISTACAAICSAPSSALAGCNPAAGVFWKAVAEFASLTPLTFPGQVLVQANKVLQYAVCSNSAQQVVLSAEDVAQIAHQEIDKNTLNDLEGDLQTIFNKLKRHQAMLSNLQAYDTAAILRLADDMLSIAGHAEFLENDATLPSWPALHVFVAAAGIKLGAMTLAADLMVEAYAREDASYNWDQNSGQYTYVWDIVESQVPIQRYVTREILHEIDETLNARTHPWIERSSSWSNNKSEIHVHVWEGDLWGRSNKKVFGKDWRCSSGLGFGVTCRKKYNQRKSQFYREGRDAFHKLREDTRKSVPIEYVAFRSLFLESYYPGRLDAMTFQLMDWPGSFVTATEAGSALLQERTNLTWAYLHGTGQLRNATLNTCLQPVTSASGARVAAVACEDLHPVDATDNITEIPASEVESQLDESYRGSFSMQQWAFHPMGEYVIHLATGRCLGVEGRLYITIEDCAYRSTPRPSVLSQYNGLHDYGHESGDQVADQHWDGANLHHELYFP